MAHHRSAPINESSAGTDVKTQNGPPIYASLTPGTPSPKGPFNIFTITSGAQIANKGVLLGGSAVTELYYTGNNPGSGATAYTAYQFGSGLWFGPITASDTGSLVADPRPGTITDITLSNATFTGGSPTATVVGAITVVMSSGTFSGTLTKGGTNASKFQLSSATIPSNLETLGVVANGSYSMAITATQTGIGGSPFTKTFTITGQTAVPIIWGLYTNGGTCQQSNAIVAANWGAGTPATFTTIEAYLHTWADFAGLNGFQLASQVSNAPPSAGGFPMLAYAPDMSGSLSQTFADINAGLHDADFNGSFQAYRNAGYTQMCIRPLWEMNEGDMTGLTASYISAFTRIYNLAKNNTFGIAIKVIWNPGSGHSATSFYPGDAVVDWIGIDESAGWDDQGNYTDPLNLDIPTYTIGGAAAFAVAHGKLLAVCEGGVANSFWNSSGYTVWCNSILSALSSTGARLALYAWYDAADTFVGGTEIWQNNQPDINAVVNFMKNAP